MKLRKRIKALLDREERRVLPTVTFRTITVCFSDRTVTIDGRKVRTESDCITMPILGGDAVFMSKDDMERIA